MLVLMALVTTFMAGPALRLIDPRGELGAPPEEEVRVAGRAAAVPGTVVPSRAVLVAFQNERALDSLMAIAEPMATAGEAREIIIVQLVTVQPLATGLSMVSRVIQDATVGLAARAAALSSRGVSARTVAFSSPDPGSDVVRLASEQNVDLVLMEGRRPLLGNGVPRGAVGAVLGRAPCDVAVLVERDSAIAMPDAAHPVVVPFSGADHDWTALELGALLARSHGAPLHLLGAEAAGDSEGRDASRLLASASLVVQRYAGVQAETVLAPSGRSGVLDAAAGAGILVIGLSERWREEGLGPVRSEIAQSASAPTLFVRRGERTGALAPKDAATRFAWSTVGVPPSGMGG